jgi:hypothetical protein
MPSPVPTIPVVTPTPGAGPTPTPTPAVSAVELLLREGDTAPGGATVADIEDAALSEDGWVGAIIEVLGGRGARGVVRRAPGGDFATVFSPDGADFDTTTLGGIQVGVGGNLLFEAGIGLDSDRLYLAGAGAAQPIAGAPPGVVSPDFRLLGEVEVGITGRVGFVGGGSPCTSMQQGGQLRVRCTANLFVSDGGSVSEVEVRDIDLSDESIGTPQVQIADSGAAYFSVPGGADAEEPTIVRFADGSVRTVLSAEESVTPVGLLVRPQLNAINAAEDLLVTTTLQQDEAPRPAVIGILRDDEFVEIARENTDATPEADDVTDLRTVGLDDEGRVLFTATLGAGDEARRFVRLFDGTSVQEIVADGDTFPGTDLTVLSVASTRINRNGDVAYVVELGRIMPGTVIVEELRAVLRLADGSTHFPVSTRGAGPIGSLSDLEIAGLGADGSLLVVGTEATTGDRVLLLSAPPA